MSLSRKTGKFKLVENGIKAEEKVSNETIDWMNKIDRKVGKCYLVESQKYCFRPQYLLLDVSTEMKAASSCQCLVQSLMLRSLVESWQMKK